MSSFPFLQLPAEIRNEIYRHALMINRIMTVERTPDGPIVKKSMIAHSDPEEWHPISTAILRTSNQIYQEASAILYGENCFQYHFYDHILFGVGPETPFGSAMNNFRSMQNLTIVLSLTDENGYVEEVCHLMKTLAAIGCSFKELRLRYDPPLAISNDYIQSYFSDDRIIDSISAIDVKAVLGITYGFDHIPRQNPITCMRDHASIIATRKAWKVEVVHGQGTEWPCCKDWFLFNLRP